jgi:alkanesulfonate monooxygenase SsuD/methylene tetrahydromethanopterin reductase-like flavin-dependent oxidoreductase (luciferase family)
MVQKPRPPVMIAGGGEQLTLRAVARLADGKLRNYVANTPIGIPFFAAILPEND